MWMTCVSFKALYQNSLHLTCVKQDPIIAYISIDYRIFQVSGVAPVSVCWLSMDEKAARTEKIIASSQLAQGGLKPPRFHKPALWAKSQHLN